MTVRKVLQDAWSVFAMVMMLIGIGGLAFSTFKTGGWGGKLLSGIFDGNHWLLGGVIATAAIVLGWLNLSGKLVVGNKTSPVYDLPVYALIIAGVYFTISWIRA